MPVYDISLWDFLKYASKQTNQDEEFFPLSERIEMTKRICDGLLYMNREKSVAHRDIKLRSVFTMSVRNETSKVCPTVNIDKIRTFEQRSKMSSVAPSVRALEFNEIEI